MVDSIKYTISFLIKIRRSHLLHHPLSRPAIHTHHLFFQALKQFEYNQYLCHFQTIKGKYFIRRWIKSAISQEYKNIT